MVHGDQSAKLLRVVAQGLRGFVDAIRAGESSKGRRGILGVDVCPFEGPCEIGSATVGALRGPFGLPETFRGSIDLAGAVEGRPCRLGRPREIRRVLRVGAESCLKTAQGEVSGDLRML